MEVRIASSTAALIVLLHPISAGVGAANRTIEVKTTAELYQQAEDPANRGSRLIVRAGHYEIWRPLRLRPGMELVGDNQYRDFDGDGVWDPAASGGWVDGVETILDARSMTPVSVTTRDCNAFSQLANAYPEPAILIGGNNWVSRVTIKASATGIAIGESGDPYGDPAEDNDDRRRRLLNLRDRLAERADGAKISEAVSVLGLSVPTVRSWVIAGILEAIPGRRPARVTYRSLALAKHALDELRRHQDDRPLLIAVMRRLRDRAALDDPLLDQALDELAAGRLTPVRTEDLDELIPGGRRRPPRSR